MTDKNQYKTHKKSLISGMTLKSIYRTPHFQTIKMFEIKNKLQQLDIRKKFSLEEIIKVEGSTFLLKTLIRGVYFFNSKILPRSQENSKRIQIFSSAMLKRIASAIKIQKVWRGYQLRKKHEKHLKAILKLQRAAIIVQRWIRKLPLERKKQFLFLATKRLWTIHDNFFYVQVQDYLNLITYFNNWKIRDEGASSFFQQEVRVYLDKKAQLLVLDWNHESQNGWAIESKRVGKLPFSKIFYLKQIGLTQDQIKAKIGYQPSLHQLCDISHLFHYETQTTIIKKNKQEYLQIKCSSRSEARFRSFILKLITFSAKNKSGIQVFASQEMGKVESNRLIDPSQNGTSFVCCEETEKVRMCQNKISRDSCGYLHIVSNKFYVTRAESRPIRSEEKLYIFSYIKKQKQVEPEPKHSQDKTHQKRYRTQISSRQQLNNHFVTDFARVETEPDDNSSANEKIKKIIMKRSMKQFKVDKRLKNRKAQPNFILDSVCMNDRLTTQAEVLKTQASNLERQGNEIMNNHQRQISSLDPQLQRSTSVDNSISYDRKGPIFTYMDKKYNAIKRKQNDNWTKRFINLGNFIQNQFANDYRRKQKTVSHHTAVESAQNIKRSIERSHSERVEKMQEKLRDVRHKHGQHQELIIKKEVNAEKQVAKMRQYVSEQRDRRATQKSKVKRLKVSFAEECYPLGNKNSKDGFS